MGNIKNLSPWSVAAGVSTIYILTMLVLCYSLPYSQLFWIVHSYDNLFQQVETSRELRSQAAKQYFSNLNPRESSRFYNDRLRQTNLTFVVGIITIQRAKDIKSHSSYGYLLQSASLVDTILKNYKFFNNSIPFICNVDAFPQKHLDAVSLYQYMPYVERYGNNSIGVAPAKIPGSNVYFGEQTSHRSKYHKETFDYAFCLLSAAALKPDYIILLEDDTLAHKDLPYVLEDLLQTRLKLSQEHADSKFMFLKLYYPAKWQGFGFEIIKLLDLLSWGVVGGSFLYVVCLLYISTKQRDFPFKRTKFFLISCLVAMISCWLIGRQNVNELRRISKHFYRLQSSEGCCTQAMLYPVNVVDKLTSYLTVNASSVHTDLAILDFSHLSGLPTYQVEPSLFFHVGLHTTLNSGDKHPEEFIRNV